MCNVTYTWVQIPHKLPSCKIRPLTSGLDGFGCPTPLPASLTPEKKPGTHCTVSWVGPRDGVDGCGYLTPTRIQFPDHPARYESLHRLSYPSPFIFIFVNQYYNFKYSS